VREPDAVIFDRLQERAVPGQSLGGPVDLVATATLVSGGSSSALANTKKHVSIWRPRRRCTVRWA